MGAETPQVSVVICHHTQRLVDACVASVFQSHGVSYDIVVVTSDPTYEDGRVARVFLQDGPAGKRNRGVASTHASYVAFLDDDVTLSPYALYELWQWLVQHPTHGMVYGKIRKMDRRLILDAAGSWMTPTGFLWDRAANDQVDHGQYDTPESCLSSKSATCMVRRTAFEQVGGFDADYWILAEESDLSARLWWHGWEVWYVPMALSFHAFDTPLKPVGDYYTLTRIHRLGARNYCKFLTTNLPMTRLVWILPFHIALWGCTAGLYLLTGQWRRGYCILAGLWDWSCGIPQDVRKRTRVQQTRRGFSTTLWKRLEVTPPLKYYLNRIRRYLTQGLHG